MLYRYNYSYLPEWMEANAQLPVNTILQAIGSKSNNSLRSWEQKLCAMPIVTLLRFCNSFQIPIEAFICNTGDPFKDKVYIPTSAQFEPDGGYTTDPALRQPGERKPLDPTNVKIVPSILPNVIAFTSSKEDANHRCGNNREKRNRRWRNSANRCRHKITFAYCTSATTRHKRS